jgi:hypothetical protein
VAGVRWGATRNLKELRCNLGGLVGGDLETSFSFASVGGSPAMVAESALQDPLGGRRAG